MTTEVKFKLAALYMYCVVDPDPFGSGNCLQVTILTRIGYNISDLDLNSDLNLDLDPDPNILDPDHNWTQNSY